MNRRQLLLLVLLSGSSWLHAQTITLSSPAQFDTVVVNTTDSLAFWVRNSGVTSFAVTDINATRPEFWIKDTSFSVPAHDSVRVYVYFKSNQNVTWKDVLVVLGTGGGLPLRWSGTARLTDSYISTQGLWENALKTALTNLVTGHTSLGYNLARDKMFETINDYDLNDTIECVYIGRRIYAPTRTQAQAQAFNTEHTWPQSFFDENEPMRSDLNHLFPTDEDPNSARGNFPFGPVVSNITYNVGGSKLGHRADGATAFEPRNVHKGDVARALFYFLIRYGNLENYMDATQESDLRVWHKSDPVSAKETQRNISVASFQGKRNPLIDHPEFADRISYFYSAAAPTLYPDIAVSAASISFGTIAAGDSVEWKLIIVNNGRASLSLTGLTLQTPSSSFKIIDTPTTVPVDSFRQVRLRFTPTQSNQTFNNTLIIQSNDPDEGTRNIALTGSTNSSTPPAQTVAVSPANGATGTSVPALFQWRVTSTATRYQFELDATGSFSSPLVSDSLLTDTLRSVSGLSFGTTYFWRVRAGNSAGWGTYSTTRSFTTWSIPAQAQVLSPTDGATNVPVPASFLWQSTPAATRYRFDLSTSNGFGSFVVVDSSLTDSSRSVPGLAANSTYYWRVRAGSGAGWGTYSVTRSFITWNTPAPVQLQSPPDQVHGIPAPVQFAWQPSPGATAYDFDLSTSPSFGTIVTSDSTLSDTTHEVPGLDTLTNYYWRVRARNNAGWGQFSVVWQFRIASTLTVTTQMLAGWNIISLPVIPVDPATTALFPTAVSGAYIYNSGYFRRDSLNSGSGYWLNLGPSQSVSVSGEPILSDTIEVNAGWNLVGSISYSLPSASVTSSPPGIITSPFYEFNDGYYPSMVLLPLKGYWVNCSQQGQIFLQGGR